MKIKLTNSFHQTTATVVVRHRADGSIYLRRSQVERARRKLCGISDCTCAHDAAGTRHSARTVVPDDADGTTYTVTLNYSPEQLAAQGIDSAEYRGDSEILPLPTRRS